MDRAQIASNIRQMSRIQLLAEVTQRSWRMLSDNEQRKYGVAFQPYTRGTSSQYTYQIELDQGKSHLEAIGVMIQSLVARWQQSTLKMRPTPC